MPRCEKQIKKEKLLGITKKEKMKNSHNIRQTQTHRPAKSTTEYWTNWISSTMKLGNKWTEYIGSC